jgi:energy-coupling factor transport system permease protein
MAIEFSRNVTFGQYLDLASPIHRLDPRVKLGATAILMVALISARSFSALAVGLFGAILLQLLSRVPVGYTLRGMRLLVGTLLIVVVFQILFYPTPQTIYWQWWVLSLSLEGILQGLLLIVRVVLVYHLVTMLLFTTSLVELADGVESLFSPLKRIGVPVNELVMAFVIALRFVPLLVAELERLVKAQAARGERLNQGSPIERARKLGTLLVPLFVNAFDRADKLTTAMNARCYRGGQGRTRRRVLRMSPHDWLALGAVLLLAAGIYTVGRVGPLSLAI